MNAYKPPNVVNTQMQIHFKYSPLVPLKIMSIRYIINGDATDTPEKYITLIMIVSNLYISCADFNKSHVIMLVYLKKEKKKANRLFVNKF